MIVEYRDGIKLTQAGPRAYVVILCNMGGGSHYGYQISVGAAPIRVGRDAPEQAYIGLRRALSVDGRLSPMIADYLQHAEEPGVRQKFEAWLIGLRP
jgi:hypothetical protein